MENEVKEILFNKIKNNFDIYEINKDDERYHKYFLSLKQPHSYTGCIRIEITKEEFNKLNLYLERGCK